MKQFKFISENTIQHLSLHDCCCSKLYFDSTSLIFEMEWMEVLASHPDNPFDKARQSGSGMIVLNDAVIDQCILSKGDKDILLNPFCEVKDFEILEFDEEPKGSGFELRLLGIDVSKPDSDFIKMNIRYSASKVMFDELCGVSWFETM